MDAKAKYLKKATSRLMPGINYLIGVIALLLSASVFSQTLTATPGVVAVGQNYQITWSSTATFLYVMERAPSGAITSRLREGTSLTYSKTVAGSYAYYTMTPPSPDCRISCPVSYGPTINVDVVAAVMPAAVGALTLGNSEGSYDLNGQIDVSWTAVANASDYRIRYGLQNTTKTTITRSASPVSISSLADGIWEFEVAACNAVGQCGTWSPIASKTVMRLPGAISGLSTTESPTYDGTYSLSWNAASNQVARYEWREKLSTTTTWPAFQSNGTTRSLALTKTVNGTYNYEVRACNAAGCGGSASLSVVVDRNAAPTISSSTLTSTNGQYSLSYASGRINGLAPDAVWIYQNGSPVLVYGRGTSPTGVAINVNANPLTRTQTTQGSFAHYTQACINPSYNTSGANTPSFPTAGTGTCLQSSSISVVVDFPTPATVGALTLGNSEGTYDTNGQIDVSWGAIASATRYEVRSGIAGGTKTTASQTATSRSFTSLTDAAWEFEVRACNQISECGAWSALASKTVMRLPGAVTGLTTTESPTYDGTYSLNWSAATNQVARYEWREKLSATTTWPAFQSNGTTRSLALTKTVNGTYNYEVRACNAAGCGGSASLSVVVDRNTAPTISSSTLTSTNGQYSLSYTSGRINGRAPDAVWIYQNGSPVLVYGSGTSPTGAAINVNTNPLTRAQTTQGSFAHYTLACINPTYNPSEANVPSFPMAGTGTCLQSSSISVVVDFPTPATVGTLTFGNSEGTIDTNGRIDLIWTSIAHATEYHIRHGLSGGTKSVVTVQVPANTAPGTSITQIFSGLTNGVWEFQVRGCNRFSECGNYSVMTSKTVMLPATPTATPTPTPTPTATPTPTSTPTPTPTPTPSANAAPTISSTTLTSSDGQYALSYAAGSISGRAPDAVWIYQNGAPNLVFARNASTVTVNINPLTRNQTFQGNYAHYALSCINPTYSAGIPNAGTGTCLQSNTITVVVDFPTPGTVGTLTLGNSEGGTDTNGRIDLAWAALPNASSYNVRYGLTGSTKNVITVETTSKVFSALANGVWEFQVRACNRSSECGNYSAMASKTVQLSGTGSLSPENIESPVSPVLATNMVSLQDQIETDKINTIGGQFNVNEGGSATYAIPFIAAEGTAGVAPEIGLFYSSASRSGVAGIGWSLSGVGSIARCKQTILHDAQFSPVTWSSEDRFCFNGSRLILVSGEYGHEGSTYQLEINSHIIVTAKGGSLGNPDYFEVKSKDGSTTRYGDLGSSDSEQAPYVSGQKQTDRVVAWAISRFEDNMGNPITYHYIDSPDDHLIQSVRYGYGSSTTSASAEIRFSYEQRSDVITSYIAGYPLKRSFRLSEVQSFNESSLVRRYVLNYHLDGDFATDNLSRLSSLDMCVSSYCHTEDISTHFEWHQPDYTISNTVNETITLINNSPLFPLFNVANYYPVHYQIADINGDGRVDVVWVDKAAVDNQRLYRLNYRISGEDSIVTVTRVSTSASVYTDVSKMDASFAIKPLDYNLDGRTDIYFNGLLFRSIPQADTTWRLATVGQDIGLGSTPEFMDLDGDASADRVKFNAAQKTLSVRYLKRNPSASVSSQTLYHYQSEVTYPLTGSELSGWSFNGEMQLGDFNGDGIPDIALLARHGITPNVECRQTSPTGGPGGTADVACKNIFREFIAVFNRKPTSQGYEYAYFDQVELSPRIEGDEWSVHSGTQTLANEPNRASFRAMDINGDGLSDVIYGTKYNGEWRFNLNTGTDFTDHQFVAAMSEFHTRQDLYFNPTFTDVNSDGFTDFIWQNTLGRFVSKVWDSTTNSFVNGSFSRYATAALTQSYLLADTNGDGWLDMVNFDGSSASSFLMKVSYGNGTAEDYPNHLYKITNGMGNETRIVYGTLIHSGHYTSLQGTNSSRTIEDVCSDYYYPGATQPIHICRPQEIFSFNIDAFYRAINDPFADLPADTLSVMRNTALPVLEAAGSMYVVTHAYSSAPNSENAQAMAGLSYFYHQYRMQAGGVGGLGFKRRSVMDHDTLRQSITTYRQDWPFAGQAIHNVTQTSSGIKLGESFTSAAILGIATTAEVDAALFTVESLGIEALGALTVYSKKTRELTYDLIQNGNAQGALLSTNTTVNTVDDYGNLLTSVVTSHDGAESFDFVRRVSTTNNYYPSDDGRFYARLTNSTVTTERPGVDTSITSPIVSKAASMNYYGSYGSGACASNSEWEGMLCEESILLDGQPVSTQQHFYDNFGNKAFTLTTDHSSGAARLSPLVVFDDRGRFLTRSYDVFNASLDQTGSAPNPDYLNYAGLIGASVRLVSEITDRNEVGLVTASTTYVDADSPVYSVMAYSPYGAAVFSADSSGMFSTTTATKNTVDCPAGSRFMTEEAKAGGAEKRTCHNATGQTLRTLVKGFQGGNSHWDWVVTEAQTDLFGRVVRTSEPYLLNASEIYWTQTLAFDVLDRPLVIQHPFFETDSQGNETGSFAQSSIVYAGNQVIRTNPMGQSTTETHNVLGEVVSVSNPQGAVTTYEYDALGQLIKMTDNAGNISRITYNALGQKISMNDPDKGIWSYTYNGFGELVCQSNALGQRVLHHYDFKGRLVLRDDYTGGSCQEPSGLESSSKWVFDTAPNGVGKLHSERDNRNFEKTYSYDSLGRPDQTITDVPATSGSQVSSHSAKVTYDQFGRIFQTYDSARDGTAFNRGAVQNIYDANGFLWRIVNAAKINGNFTEEYYRVNSMDSRGNVTSASYGNGAANQVAEINPHSGFIERLVAQNMGGLNILQDLTMQWDHAGNLASRLDKGHKANGQRRNLLEEFAYDGANQLTNYSVTGDVSHSTNITYTSDLTGNIASKSDVGNYSYQSSKPHAVTHINGVATYTYNANGDMLGGAGRTLTYTVFGKVASVTKNGKRTDYYYGPDRERYKRVDTDGTKITTTLYLGGVEKITYSDNTAQWKRSIGGVAQVTLNFANGLYQNQSTYYLLKDHLGSITTLVDSGGQVVERMAFDPWGKRRNTDSWQALAQTTIESNYFIAQKPLTNRGFTGHEMVDEAGIINMNGRIYDASLARFMQADPFIQDPFSAGSLNRYSYVMNNPLNAVDPSGYFSLKTELKNFAINAIRVATFGIVGVLLNLDKLIAKNPMVAQLFTIGVGIVSTIACGPCSIAITAMVTADMAYHQSGGDFNAAMKAGLTSAISSSIFYGIGKAFQMCGSACAPAAGTSGFWGSGLNGAAFADKIIMHALAGGVMSKMQGGSFRTGAFAAGFSALGTYIGAATSKLDIVGGTIKAALIGGTASKISGGKFANGAVTGAYSYLFNQALSARREAVAQKGVPVTDAERAFAEDGNRKAFWTSRAERGDPMGQTALDIVNNEGLITGKAANFFAKLGGGADLDLEALGVDLMRAHVRAVDIDKHSIPHYLNAEQVQRYHLPVFEAHNIPTRFYGGNIPFNASADNPIYFIHRAIYCPNCDKPF